MVLTEKEELVLLRNSSGDSFERLYIRYSPKLYNFVMKISKGDSYIAEELVQRAFIKIWETREQVNPEKSFISYLCTIAKNMLMNEYEHQTVQYLYNEYIKVKMVEHDNSTEKIIDRDLLEEYIDRITDKLPPKRREIFVLSRKEGYSNKKISAHLNISESTVETQLSKALSFLKNKLQEHYEYVLIVLTTIFIK